MLTSLAAAAQLTLPAFLLLLLVLHPCVYGQPADSHFLLLLQAKRKPCDQPESVLSSVTQWLSAVPLYRRLAGDLQGAALFH